jgi:hypothetical protein
MNEQRLSTSRSSLQQNHQETAGNAMQIRDARRVSDTGTPRIKAFSPIEFGRADPP